MCSDAAMSASLVYESDTAARNKAAPEVDRVGMLSYMRAMLGVAPP